MTLDNRPNLTEEEDDLEAIAEAANQPVAQVVEDVVVAEPNQQPQQVLLEPQEPLFPNDLPDFTPSIEEINRSLNSIQEEITNLVLRSGPAEEVETRPAASSVVEIHQQEAEEDDEDFVGEYQDLDKNLDKIDEALTKLDQENAVLQDKLRELLESIRANNHQS